MSMMADQQVRPSSSLGDVGADHGPKKVSVPRLGTVVSLVVLNCVEEQEFRRLGVATVMTDTIAR